MMEVDRSSYKFIEVEKIHLVANGVSVRESVRPSVSESDCGSYRLIEDLISLKMNTIPFVPISQ